MLQIRKGETIAAHMGGYMVDKMEILTEEFKNLVLFGKALQRPKNSVMSSRNESTSTKKPAWYGTTSYEEAEHLLKVGYQPNIKKLSSKVKTTPLAFNRPINKFMVAGCIPNVSQYLANNPNCMVRPIRNGKGGGMIDIGIILGAAWHVEADDILETAANILSAIKHIMSKHTDIKYRLYCYPKLSYNISKTQLVGAKVLIKNYNQCFNLAKLSYPLTHVSFFRRQGFKWMETTELNISSEFSENYGCSAGYEYTDKELTKMLGLCAFSIPKNLESTTEHLAKHLEGYIKDKYK